MVPFLKKLFSHEAPGPARPAPAQSASATVVEKSRRGSPPAAEPSAAPEVNGSEISPESLLRVPLAAIVKGLPEALRKRVVQPPKPGPSFALPLATVVAQLPRGSVKITFGQLRLGSPPGVFDSSDSDDPKLINIPLGLVLGQLKAGTLALRPGQRPAALPPAIGPLFTERGGIVPQAMAPLERADATKAGAPPAAAPALTATGAAPPAVASQRVPTAAHAQAPAQLPAEPLAPTRTPKIPLATPAIGREMSPGISESTANSLRLALRSVMANWPPDVRQAVDQLGSTYLLLPLPEAERGLGKGKLVFAWKQLRGWLEPVPSSEAGVPAETLLPLPLQLVIPLYLPLQRQVHKQRKVTVPEHIPNLFGAVGSGSKAPATAVESQAKGPAKAVSAPPAATPPPAVVLAPPREDLPASEPAPPAPPSLVVSIPSPAPPPVSLRPAAATRAPDLPAVPVAPQAAAPPPTSVAVPPQSQGLAELFGQPGKTMWTPVEIVQQTAKLPGVGGAIIALQDGFLVAGQMPPELNREVIAAFLPQMFGRMSHYTRELKLGETCGLTLAVNGQWLQIFKAGTLFLLVLGKPGESLPVAPLNAVAAQLARQSQPN